MRIRHKLLVILACSTLVFSVLVGAGAVWLVRSAVRENFVERSRAETALLAEWVRERPADGMQALAVTAAAKLGVRITFIAADGVVVADSARDPMGVLRMDNHSDRPEVRGALLQGTGDSLRTSDTTHEQYFYSARRVEGPGRVKLVRIALPARQVHQRQTRYAGMVMGVVTAAMLLLTALAYGAVRRLSKPVERMSTIAERTAQGELDLEVPGVGRDEVSGLATAVNRMKQALVEKIGELEDERSLLASVISGMREGLLVVGSDRRVRLANQAVCKIFDLGFDPTGRLLPEVVRHPTVLQDLEVALTEGREARETIIRMEGSGSSFELHITPIGGRNGGGRAVLVLFFDITRLEALEGVRREFVANVSHELRTPLTSIKAFVETLVEEGLENRKNSLEFLEIIRKHADRMGALIEDLTDLSLIETGAIAFDLRAVDAAQVVREVVEQLQSRSREREVRVSTDLPSPFPVKADRRRLEQMLTNLVDNAIKFNRPQGEVWVRGRIEKDRPVLIVEDTGVGIPADSVEKIFHRFYRVDPDRSRKAGGTGLGLAIVKHLARLHRASLRVESELGQGTRFTLEFPAAEQSGTRSVG